MQDTVDCDDESDLDEEADLEDLNSKALVEELAKIASKEDDNDEWLPKRYRRKRLLKKGWL